MTGERFGEVLGAARRAEPDALAALYRQLAPAVLGYLRGQGAVEPEDLVSEVFVGVVRGLRGFHGDESDFRSWVFTIAHRRLLDERRRLGRRREVPTSPEGLRGLAGRWTGDVEGEAFERIERDHVQDLLGGLSADQRTVVLLRVIAGLSVREVARVLGKREGAVKMLQRRALLKLAGEISLEDVT